MKERNTRRDVAARSLRVYVLLLRCARRGWWGTMDEGNVFAVVDGRVNQDDCEVIS